MIYKLSVIIIICLLFVPQAWAWEFTIAGTLSDDAGMQEASPDVNNYTASSHVIGIVGTNDYMIWMACPALSDTLALPAYAGDVTSAYWRVQIAPATSRLTDDADTIKICAYPCRRIPVETQVTWNVWSTGQYWSIPGALSTAEDIYNAPGDTVVLSNDNTAQFTYHNVYLDVDYINAGVEDFIIKPVYVVSTDYSGFYSFNSGYAAVLYVTGSETAPSAGASVGGVTLGGITVGK